MKNLLFISFLILFPSFGFSQNNKLEEKHGIRDIKLDTPKSKYTDLYRVQSSITCGEMYQRKNENLLIGYTKAEKIQYLYIDNILFGIYIYFRSDEDILNVLKALFELYGEPDAFDKENDQIKWYGITFHVSATTSPNALSYVKDNFSSKCDELQNRKINRLKGQL